MTQELLWSFLNWLNNLLPRHNSSPRVFNHDSQKTAIQETQGHLKAKSIFADLLTFVALLRCRSNSFALDPPALIDLVKVNFILFVINTCDFKCCSLYW